MILNNPFTKGFSPPEITDEDIAEVISVLKSGWITTGPKVKEFEEQIAEYCGTGKAACLSSQTACAEMTLRLLGVGPGDEVIVPAYTYTATASVVLHVGAELIMVDSQPDSLEMDYDKLAQSITNKTKVIIPVDLAGIICDYDKILSIVESKKSLFRANNELQKAFNRIIIMADSAHSFGAVSNGKRSGNIADFSNFSFHAVKNLTTAEGGAVTWKANPNMDSEWIYNQFKLMSFHGQSKDAFTKEISGAWEYDIVDSFYKCNMTDIQAALGVSQLRRYDKILARRREIIETYDKALKPLNLKTLEHYSEKKKSSGHLYMIFAENNVVRDSLINELTKKMIPFNIHYKPLPMFSAYKKLGFNIEDYPNAYKAFNQELTLPLYNSLTDEQIGYVVNCIKQVL